MPRRQPRIALCALECRVTPATFTVTNLNDAGPGSLRRAVQDANALPGADGVAFDPSVIGIITLTTGQISINDALAINGPGANKLVVSAGNAGRVFSTTASPGAPEILVQGLELTQGKAEIGGALWFDNEVVTVRQCLFTNSNATAAGGAIGELSGVVGDEGAGRLLVEDCVFSGNSGPRGGAIYNNGSALTVRRTTISNNTAGGGVGGGGGGIRARSLVLEDSTVADNVVNSQGDGGGIAISLFPSSAVIISGSTISGNSAGVGWGGGVHVFVTTGGSALVRNCTVSGNSAGGSGGGVAVDGNLPGTALVTVANTTVTGNVATSGGGVRVAGYPNLAASLELQSTILAGNVVTQGASGREDLDVTGAPPDVAGNNNFIGIMDALNNANLTGSGNLKGSVASPLDAKLGPLADNGGLTKTHALTAASLAINTGNNAAGLTSDQRGFAREIGVAADIGAYEVITGLVVTNTNDAGPGSLRQAVLDANAGVDSVISFSPLFATPQVITLSSGALVIQKAMEIIGPGPQNLTLLPTGLNRIMSIGVTPQFLNSVRIASMSFKNANHTGGASNRGGAIFILDEAVTVSNCVFENNTAASGGAIYLEFATGFFTVEDCRFINNKTTSGSGAAIHINSGSGSAPITIRRSLISGNSAASSGGGIFVRYGPTTIDSCTIVGNTAANGGGIHVSSTSGGMLMRNSTISSNAAGVSGGGVLTLNSSKALTVQNSTVVGNSAGTGVGGGIARVGGTGVVAIDSCIVSGNTNATAADVSSVGTVNVNFSAVGDSKGFTLTGANNLPFGADLKLGPLAFNGGPTPTHALLTGSPAVNAGSNPAALTTDQRGAGFARNVNGVDVGAFEAQGSTSPAKVTQILVNGGAAQRSRVTQIAVTFDTPPVLPFNLAGAFQLRRQGDNAAVTVGAAAAGNVVTLSFTGGAADSGSLADGRYTLTVLASQIMNLDGNADGTPGDDFVLVGDPATNKLFRLFGDGDGDGDVDAVDYGQFRVAFGGSSNLAFDFDNDGDVDAVDLGAFRPRFGSSV